VHFSERAQVEEYTIEDFEDGLTTIEESDGDPKAERPAF
jgi:hypothetical protein